MRYAFQVEKIHTLTLKPDEVLLVKVPDADMAQIKRIQDYLINLLESKKILVYSGTDIECLKLGLEEHLVDEFLEKELSKK